MKVVINSCYGGFGLSEQALEIYGNLSGEPNPSMYDIKRDDPYLIAVVEQLGGLANTRFSDLKVVEIPDGTKWYIAEYDGIEWVAEGETWS